MGHLMNSSQAAEHVLLIIDSGEFMDLIYNVENATVFVSTLTSCCTTFIY